MAEKLLKENMQRIRRNAAHSATRREVTNARREVRKHESSRFQAKPYSILIPIFMISLVIPIELTIGTLRLSPYRVILILTFVPCVIAWVSGRIGRINFIDICIFLYCIWAFLAVIVNHGFEYSIQPSGMLLLETFGCYLLARYIIRDSEDFRLFVKSLVWVIVILIPFGIIETVTGKDVVLDWVGKIFHTFRNVPRDPRWGLDRVQGPFEHPILFGIFCSSGFALSIYTLGEGLSIIKRTLRAVPSIIGTFLSLSSGPLSALIAQALIIGWDFGMRRVKARWAIFFGLVAAVYIVIDFLSNRDPIRVFISYATFNPHGSFNRILIWDYGSAEVIRHPVFGIGFNDWERLWFMPSSIDMFWLIHAIRYGLPAAILILLSVFLLVGRLGYVRDRDPKVCSYRTGLVVTISGLFLAGWTVHYWNATYCLFMFLLGSGVWIIDRGKSDNISSEESGSSVNQKGRLKRKSLRDRRTYSSNPVE